MPTDGWPLKITATQYTSFSVQGFIIVLEKLCFFRPHYTPVFSDPIHSGECLPKAQSLSLMWPWMPIKSICFGLMFVEKLMELLFSCCHAALQNKLQVNTNKATFKPRSDSCCKCWRNVHRNTERKQKERKQTKQQHLYLRPLR